MGRLLFTLVIVAGVVYAFYERNMGDTVGRLACSFTEATEVAEIDYMDASRFDCALSSSLRSGISPVTVYTDRLSLSDLRTSNEGDYEGYLERWVRSIQHQGGDIFTCVDAVEYRNEGYDIAIMVNIVLDEVADLRLYGPASEYHGVIIIDPQHYIDHVAFVRRSDIPAEVFELHGIERSEAACWHYLAG